METRAQFVLIGLFTLSGLVGGLLFFLWLASVQIDRQYAQYGVLFDSALGLDQSAEVLFNGVSVGRVTDIRIWERDPSKAFVELEIDATTPVAVDTVARLETQGVTGVAYIALAGGAARAEQLTLEADGLPIIASRPSSFQSLVSGAPEVLADAANIIAQLELMLNEENRRHINNILANVDNATAGLEGALMDFSNISARLDAATGDVAAMVGDFEGVGAAVKTTLEGADTTLATISTTFDSADRHMDALGPVLDRASAALLSISELVETDISPAAADFRATLGYADAALASVDRAFGRVDDIMGADIGPALTDARAALGDFADAVSVFSAEVAGAVTDLGPGISEARAAFAEVGPGMREFRALGSEARATNRALQALIRRLSQDPTGILLGDRVPDYRR
ncbi:MAG: MlaD family protein [Pseudomonadota bacterium]